LAACSRRTTSAKYGPMYFLFPIPDLPGSFCFLTFSLGKYRPHLSQLPLLLFSPPTQSQISHIFHLENEPSSPFFHFFCPTNPPCSSRASGIRVYFDWSMFPYPLARISLVFYLPLWPRRFSFCSPINLCPGFGPAPSTLSQILHCVYTSFCLSLHFSPCLPFQVYPECHPLLLFGGSRHTPLK